MVDITSFIANMMLFFSKEILLIPTIAFGYHFVNRKIFTNATIMLLFMMILNTYLKSIWKIPLPEHISKGWAFPSGHIASACVFWGYLALEYRNKNFSIFVVLVLASVGWALTYFGYHKLIYLV